MLWVIGLRSLYISWHGNNVTCVVLSTVEWLNDYLTDYAMIEFETLSPYFFKQFNSAIVVYIIENLFNIYL